MKFNMIFKKVKEFIMKYWLQLIGLTTIIVMVIGIFSVVMADNQEDKIPADRELEWYSQQIEFYQKNQVNAHNMAEAARALGYADDHSIIQTAKSEWTNAQAKIEELTLIIDNIKAEEEARLTRWRTEYPVATQVWEYLDNKGYNDYVKAGILGNMMAEAGGQTLDIKVDATSPGYYGICQWSLRYNPQMNNTDLITQLDFLTVSMEQEFNNYGKNYKAGFNYSTFTTMLDEEEAALAFVKCYERCGSGSYNKRKANAKKALEYYTS